MKRKPRVSDRNIIMKAEERLFRIFMFLSTFLIAVSLFLLVASILIKGLPALSWNMISQTPKGGYYFGKEGGILNAIIGSLYLSIGATFLAFIIGLPVALFMNIHLVNRNKTGEFNPFPT